MKKVCIIQTDRESDEWTAFLVDDPSLAVYGSGPQATLGLLVLALGDKLGIELIRVPKREESVPTTTD